MTSPHYKGVSLFSPETFGHDLHTDLCAVLEGVNQGRGLNSLSRTEREERAFAGWVDSSETRHSVETVTLA